MPELLDTGASGRNIHLLYVPTLCCNLDCAYCFFLAKEMLYSATTLRRKLRVNEERGHHDSNEDEVPAFLRQQGLQGRSRT